MVREEKEGEMGREFYGLFGSVVCMNWLMGMFGFVSLDGSASIVAFIYMAGNSFVFGWCLSGWKNSQ